MLKRIFFLISIFFAESYAVKVELMGKGITDDEIAKSIKNHRPISVSEIIEQIEKEYTMQLDQIEVLDFRNNNITGIGAQQILEFAEKLSKLEELNFLGNYIYDESDKQGFERFENAVIALLKKEDFKKLDIRLNGIANISWYTKMASIKGCKSQKIVWKNDKE